MNMRKFVLDNVLAVLLRLETMYYYVVVNWRNEISSISSQAETMQQLRSKLAVINNPNSFFFLVSILMRHFDCDAQHVQLCK